MKLTSKRLSKSLLASVLALILVGSAAAAFVWISNIRTTVVTVSPYPIVLEGDFADASYVTEETLQLFNLTINDPAKAVGYVSIRFIAPGQVLNPSDIEVDLTVELMDPAMGGFPSIYDGYLVPGYPTNTPTDQLTFLFGDSVHDPFYFAYSEFITNGTINVRVTYNVAYTMEASIRVTSTSS